jgi:ferric iron reductase protein FhuF
VGLCVDKRGSWAAGMFVRLLVTRGSAPWLWRTLSAADRMVVGGVCCSYILPGDVQGLWRVQECLEL